MMWSTVATAFKITLRHTSVFGLVFLSSFFSLLCFALILFGYRRTSPQSIFTLSRLKTGFFRGLLNPVIYYIVLFQAYSLLLAQHAQAINYTWGITLGIAAALYLKQKFTVFDVIGSIISWVGVAFIIYTNAGPSGSINLVGVFLALFSTVLWSFYWIWNSDSSEDEVTVFFFNFLWGTIISGLILVFSGFPSFSMYALAGGAWIGIFEMGITFLFWLRAMKLSENASDVTTLIFLSPFISLVFIGKFAGESVSLLSIVGLTIIVAGLIFRQKMKKKE